MLKMLSSYLKTSFLLATGEERIKQAMAAKWDMLLVYEQTNTTDDGVYQKKIIDEICAMGKSLARIQLETITLTVLETFAKALETESAPVAAELQRSSANMSITPQLLQDLEQIINFAVSAAREKVKQLMLSLEAEQHIVSGEEYIEQILPALQVDLLKIKAEAQIKIQTVSYSLYLVKAKAKYYTTLERDPSHNESHAGKITLNTITYLEKIIEVCKCAGENLTPVVELFLKDYIGKMESLYNCRQNSNIELLSLQHDLAQEITAEMLSLRSKICSIEIKQQRLDLSLLRMAIAEQVENSQMPAMSEHFKLTLIDTLRKKILYAQYLSSLKEILAAMQVVDACKQALAIDTKDSAIKLNNQCNLAHAQSLVLAYGLEALFDLCDLNNQTGVEVWTESQAERLATLIDDYWWFHLQRYGDSINPSDEFMVEQNLLLEICSVNALFNKACIENFQQILRATDQRAKLKLSV